MRFPRSPRFRHFALAILVALIVGGLGHRISAQSCTDVAQSGFEWPASSGNWWQWSVTTHNAYGAGHVCIDGNGYLVIQSYGAFGSADIFVGSYSAVSPGYGYYTEVANVINTDTSLMSPGYLYGGSNAGASVIEMANDGGYYPLIRYAVWDSNGPVVDDTHDFSSYYATRQYNIIEWYGGNNYGASPYNTVKFYTDMLDPWRYRAYDHCYRGAAAPGDDQTMRFNMMIGALKDANNQYVENSGDTMTVKSFGKYTLTGSNSCS